MGWIDGFTWNVLLKTATSWWNWADLAAKLYKELNADQAPAHKIAQAQDVYKKLWYKPWAIVLYGLGCIGEITWFRNNTMWMYWGDRYPVDVKWPWGTYEQSIFITHYEDVPKYKDNPQQLLTDYKDDLLLKLVTDISNPKEVMHLQSEIAKMNFFSIVDYLEEYIIEWDKEKDYVYTYALARLAITWEKELNLIKKASDYIDSDEFAELENTDVKNKILEKYFWKLSSHNKMFWYTTKTPEVISLYNFTKNKEYKETIKNIIIDRIKNMQANELYTFATSAKGTDFEDIALTQLETHM